MLSLLTKTSSNAIINLSTFREGIHQDLLTDHDHHAGRQSPRTGIAQYCRPEPIGGGKKDSNLADATNAMSASPARRAPARRTHIRVDGSGTATPEGSATQTITSAPPQPDALVLRLRGAHGPEPGPETLTETETEAGGPETETRRRIQWAEDVVDNEGLGRKKSKVCCIFHKTREVGESSSEDDSSSSDSDGGSTPSDEDGAARPVGGTRRRGRRRDRKHGHDHEHGHDCKQNHGHGDEKRKPSPNAYEKMPKYDVKPLERQPGA